MSDMQTAGPIRRDGAGKPVQNEDEIVVALRPHTYTLWNRIRATAVTAILIHYLLWLPAVLALFAALAAVMWRFGFSWYACAAPSVLALCVYVPSFTDGSHKKLGREWPAFRMSTIWRSCHEYGDVTIIRTHSLDADKKYVFGFHPHGILILSRLAMYGGIFERLFPGIKARTLGATPIFMWPGSREVSLWLGAVDAARRVAHRVLQAGLSLVVYPGGSKEIFTTGKDAAERTTTFVLKDVKGFVRLAIQHGAPLVPVVVYNERDAYRNVDLPAGLRAWCLKKLRMPMLLFYGRYGTLLPHQVKLGIVFGAPMDVPHIADAPDKPHADPKVDAIVDQVHAQYMEQLTTLWHAHKERFGYAADEPLRVV